MGRVVERMMCVAGVMMMLWVASSWCEVVTKNGQPNPEYSKYNAFSVCIKLGGR